MPHSVLLGRKILLYFNAHDSNHCDQVMNVAKLDLGVGVRLHDGWVHRGFDHKVWTNNKINKQNGITRMILLLVVL